MLTVDDLCAEMIAADRHLTPRAARDWWTKGLLPRPTRRGVGRGKGTETFWPNRRVVKQAQAVNDLLARHARTYTAIVGIWLLGFPVDGGRIRAAYGRLISRHERLVRGRRTKPPEDAVADMAEQIFSKSAYPGAPAHARSAAIDLAIKFLETFYDIDEALESNDLADLWKKARPHLSASSPDMEDNDIGAMLRYMVQWASLSAQRDAMSTASDYEIVRARRLIYLGLGCLRRALRATPTVQIEGCADEFAPVLLGLGRPAVPILITILRDPSLRDQIIRFLLSFPNELGQTVPLRHTTDCDASI